MSDRPHPEPASETTDFSDRLEVVELHGRWPMPGDIDVLLFDACAPHNRDVRLMDLMSPGGPKIVVFSWSLGQRAFESAALERGAVAYLSKTLPALAELTALEEIHAGDLAASPCLEPPGVTSPVTRWV